jgi:ABC-type amino acid transport substrate-binding protein
MMSSTRLVQGRHSRPGAEGAIRGQRRRRAATAGGEAPAILGRLAASVVCIALLMAATPGAAAAGDLAKVKKRGRLVVLCWPHQESIFVRRMVELGDEGLRTFGGIDVDIVEAFARSLGVTADVRAVSPDFGALIPSLLDGDGDLVASSLSITRARAKKVGFSVPYFEVRKVVIARRGSGYASVSDLAGKRAAAARGTSHDEQLRELGFDDESILATQFILDNYSAVAEGDVDFTVVDSTSARRVLGQYPELGEALEVAFEFPQVDYFAMASRPGSDLLPVLDRFLTELHENGELERIVAGHLKPGE